MEKLNRLIEDRRGAGMFEYLILVGVIAIIGIVAFGDFGQALSDKTGEFEDQVTDLGNQ